MVRITLVTIGIILLARGHRYEFEEARFNHKLVPTLRVVTAEVAHQIEYIATEVKPVFELALNPIGQYCVKDLFPEPKELIVDPVSISSLMDQIQKLQAPQTADIRRKRHVFANIVGYS